MTARTLAHQRREGRDVNDVTAKNIMKVTRFREGGEDDLEKMVGRFERLKRKEDKVKEDGNRDEPRPR